ncbi:UDP-N-acetylmuramate dehydrogenase [Parabacteroides sp. PF5-5]|uniref:UDP-N-acetylmuramate dehydrogenase n=1 Tax=unclassified Parabacteroides TaxID=2649774 RepID=UPI002476EA57|nr:MULTISPECIES: UDP-N-acetylmuramate dehydrogenase [unclassified Parabacteroides]MDH6307040.1 UDP-N-acetylmuramate dehydrogenase [Parabacteroides sp. PH5-39]MDH6317955.1 UDP-N-acetylmuramate dehydrogenase [Parabacteroides sp. PF5-13]MDH6321692.1 UDP-N-acetylmuramate dehydrogenase [Parabacteroides sp. PH5-13]MDH6325443.1 UDP-N-acetylmuramate dehydrogenase [Parabacteroides sp. PH5-8]MDH6329154.1 UDP-N-acetylmuramate dehydrogenase [Parabacteroides sp. PH5-41]
MRIEENYSLTKHNTFRLPVKTRWFMEYETEEELSRILHDEYFQECISLHIGSGSNLLFINNYNGIILHSLIKGIEVVAETDETVCLRVGAAEIWDNLVAYTVTKGWYGIENLSDIPGECGAAAIQNIGAYGVEIKDVIEAVETYNQLTFEKRIFTQDECEYAYRHSYFKNEDHDPYIVTHIRIRLSKNPVYTLQYGNLKEMFAEGEISLAGVRDAVIGIRKQKLPDPEVIGNAGSFFMNPLISMQQYDKLKKQYPDLPSYPAGEQTVKIPAAWLIEQCGFKGKAHGQVGVYEKQALILTNLGDATGHEIALVAESIRAAVSDRFGVELMPEVKYIG